MKKLLDLFCGAGGSAVGYNRAGFEIFGVDNRKQKNYPFQYIQHDAIDFLFGTDLSEFDVIHASPPCQKYSVANNIHGNQDHPDLVGIVRDLLINENKPYIIENVMGAPLINPVKVCGRALGCGVRRHRLFESNIPLKGTVCPIGHPGDWVSVFGHTVLERGHVVGRCKGGGPSIKRRHLGIERGHEAMGIAWMNRNELSEAIPPVYTEFIGRQVMDYLKNV